MTSGGKRTKFLEPEQIESAIREVDALARREGESIALAGGAALQVYGSPRLTVDVDFLATGEIPLADRGAPLSFGGFQAHTAGGVHVDLIIRDDEWREMYEAALEYAPFNADVGVPVVQAEHMVAIKMAADRPKDIADLQWLLLDAEIDYKRARSFVAEFMGKYASQELDKARDVMRFERDRLPKETR